MTSARPGVLLNLRIERLIRTASGVFTWVAGAAVLAMVAVTAIDVAGRYFLGQPVTSGHALVQALVFVVVFLGLPLLSSMRGYMRVELLDTALPPRLARIRQRSVDGAATACLVVFGLQFLWQGRYYGYRGEYIEMLEIPLAWFAYLGGALCLFAALLTAARLFLPPRENQR